VRSRAPSTSGWRFRSVCGRCGKRRPKFILVLLASHRTLWGGKPADPAVHIQRAYGAQWLTSARFPQCNSQGSGITDNCHCQTSELLIVTAAGPGACIEPAARARSGFKGLKARKCRSARRARGATNEPCRKRASIRAGLRRDVGHPRHLKSSRRCGVGRRYSRVHEDLLLDAHHLPGWQDGG